MDSKEAEYLEKTKKEFFKFAVGESYLEFLSDGEEKDVTYKEGDVKRKMCYLVNAFDKAGHKLNPSDEPIDYAMPRTLLDAMIELREQNGGVIVGGWLKVKRVGTTVNDTKYTGFPCKKPVF